MVKSPFEASLTAELQAAENRLAILQDEVGKLTDELSRTKAENRQLKYDNMDLEELRKEDVQVNVLATGAVIAAAENSATGWGRLWDMHVKPMLDQMVEFYGDGSEKLSKKKAEAGLAFFCGMARGVLEYQARSGLNGEAIPAHDKGDVHAQNQNSA